MASSATSGNTGTPAPSIGATYQGRLGIESFYAWACERWSPSTARSYRRNSIWFLLFLKGLPPATFAEWPVTLLAEFVTWISKQREYHPRTLRGILVAAQRYLDYMRHLGIHIPELPNPALDYAPVPETPTLTLMQIERLLDLLPAECPNPTRRAALSIMPFSGLNAEEIAALRIRDVKVTAPWVTFHVNGKSPRPRMAYLMRPGQEPFLRHLSSYIQRGEIASDSWLFPNSHGGRLYTRQLRKDIRTLRDKLDIPWLTSTALAQTYRGLLERHDVRPSVIAHLTGEPSPGLSRPDVTHEDVTTALNSIHRA